MVLVPQARPAQRDRQVLQVPLEQLAILARQEPKAQLALPALQAQQGPPLQLLAQLALLDPQARLDRRGQLAPLARQVFKATSDQPDLLAPQGRLGQLGLPGLLGRKVFKA